MSRRSAAFETFRAGARRLAPTRRHRAVLWENMFGTVYAVDPNGRVEYFDYNYAAAMRHVGPVEDVRVARHVPYRTLLHLDGSEDYMRPRAGQLVWFAVTVEKRQR